MSKLKGVGVGLRHQHYTDILQEKPNIAWFEVLTDNYLDSGPPLNKLLSIREHYPMALHGVGLSIGSADPLDINYLQQVKKLIDTVEPISVSDHLCWTGIDAKCSHELLPLPYTEALLQHVISRVHQVQELWQRPLLLENISHYLSFEGDYSETEFLNTLAHQTGCGILLDVNNVWVNAHNHHYNPLQYIHSLESQYVKQMHLGGHEKTANCLIDTHGAKV